MKIRATFRYARTNATDFIWGDYDDRCYSKGAIDEFEQLECDSHEWWCALNKHGHLTVEMQHKAREAWSHESANDNIRHALLKRTSVVVDDLRAYENMVNTKYVHQIFEGAATEHGQHDDTDMHEKLLEFAHEFVYGRDTLNQNHGKDMMQRELKLPTLLDTMSWDEGLVKEKHTSINDLPHSTEAF